MNLLPPRRWLPVVLATLVLVGFTPHQATAQNAQTVSSNSPLIPDVDGNGPDLIGGQMFRLLFLTNTGINGESDVFGPYNTHVQTAANNSDLNIQGFSSQFRALVSVGNDMNNNARNNTATTGAGVPIYWLLGAKVADNYGNFYNGSWDSRVATNEHGRVINNPFLVWTGSKFDGTRAVDGSDLRTMGTSDPRVGLLNIEATGPVGPIDGGPGAVRRRALELPLYAMSPVITVRPDLSNLVLSGNPPMYPSPFDPATTDYSVSVPNDTTIITLTPTFTNPTATIDAGTVPPVAIDSGAARAFPLSMGDTRVSIVLPATAANGQDFSNTYTISINRLPPPPAAAPTEGELLIDSLLVPDGMQVGSKIRLLFVGSGVTPRNDNHSFYNTSVIRVARNGHADIRPFSDHFRALVSTHEVDARDNTATNHVKTPSDTDAPIYWVNGDKVADDYADFYDGSWDSRVPRNSAGNAISDGTIVLTGSLQSGRGQPRTRIGNRDSGVRIGRLDQGEGNEIDAGTGDNAFRPLYGLSPVLTLVAGDSLISFQQAEYSIFEGTTGTITLVADPPPKVKTQIRLTTLSETAISDAEYQLSTTIITFAPNQSVASFEVSIIDDDILQVTNRQLRLSFELPDDADNATLGTVTEAVIIVKNDDVEISLTTPGARNSLIVTEGSDPSATLQLNFVPSIDRVLSVNLLYTEDVGALTGALTSDNTQEMSTVIMVAANTAVRNFAVDVKDDQIAAESTRTATILLEPGSGYLVSNTKNTVELVVRDNDVAAVSFSQSTGTITEGEPIELIITQDLITDIATSVNITFTPTGNFFKTTPMTTQVNFPAGAAMSTTMIRIETVNDTDMEANGSLRANIMIMPGSPLQPGTLTERTVTILNDDVPAISFQQGAYTIFEGTTGTITLVAKPPPLVKIQISLTTLSETTILDAKYRLSTTIITFEPNQSEASFEVSIIDDNDVQVTRELILFLVPLDSNSTPGTVSVAVISVKDNAAPIAGLEIVGVVGDDIRLEEGANATLRVTLDRAFGEVTDIQIETAGTATTADYTITVNPVTLSAGSTSVETRLMIIPDDNDQEPDKTIILTLDAVNNQIIDDEPGAQLTLTIGAKVLLFRMKVFLEGAQ